MGSESLHVAVVSCQELVRAGLTRALTADPERLVVVDVTSQVGHLSGLDAAVYDLAGLMRGTDDLRHLVECGIPVVALRPDGRPDLGEGAIASGAAAVVPMSIAMADLMETIELAASARPRQARATAGGLQHQHRATAMVDYGLSERELDILELVGTGVSNQEIADALFVGLSSVKSYIRTAYRKLGIESRSQAVLWVLHHHLAPAERPGQR